MKGALIRGVPLYLITGTLDAIVLTQGQIHFIQTLLSTVSQVLMKACMQP